jgi:hypothetical protein
MIDELSTKFTSDAPSQSAQTRAARRKNRRELRGHIEIFSDNPHIAVRYVRDGAIARKRADPQLNLCRPMTGMTFALSPIHKHPTPPALVDFLFRQSYRKSVGLGLSGRCAIDDFPYRKIYRCRSPRLGKSRPR